MGYCLGDKKDCAALNEHILSYPCWHEAAVCISTQRRESSILLFALRDIGSTQLEVTFVTWVVFI